MSILFRARALAVAILVALSMAIALPATNAEAHGASRHSHSAKHHHHARKAKHSHVHKAKHHRSAKRTRTAKRKAHRHHAADAKPRHARQAQRTSARKHKRTRTASHRRHRMSLGATTATRSRAMHRSSGGGGGVAWSASSGCLNATLRSVIHQVAASFGSLRVNSTCRSRGHNARVGGARRSHHLTGDAVDFRVFGNVGAVSAFLRSHGSIGGFKHYGGGLFHIDTGPRRRW